MDGEDFRILSRLSSDTGVKEDSVFLVQLGPVTEDGVEDCSVDLIIKILSEKNLQKVFSRSVLFVQSGRAATEDLCKIFLKQFHKALRFLDFQPQCWNNGYILTSQASYSD